MEHNSQAGAALPAAYLAPGTSSFVDFLRAQAPELLPFNRVAPGARPLELAHGTTIVAVAYKGGVLIAGDRRATQGNVIAHRDMDKVYVTDEYSAVGIAGTAGLAVEMVRLYQLELEHYEKLEGVTITLDGKANRLGAMIKGNLEAAMAGLVVLPLFVGYDVDAPDPARAGRIVTYDVTGGRFDEHAGYHSIGSGSVFAKGSLKKLYDPDADQDAAVRTAIEALYDAADDDSATSGPDMVRRIFPVVITVNGADGAVRLSDEVTAQVSEAVVADRTRG
ncbi:proteasome subunit beta [Kutzneria buriramensis]|uniref:Proteasome subunit beta n=1 Tax=Kutzneria buriramensis TaxID=1045776 RepID=A0A3E0H064_9PSEU|nr:proteasome subunit beta [Kutzneria buriramensis]REH35224.1 proteasome beta subunit [Kutzneria buriramensis]